MVQVDHVSTVGAESEASLLPLAKSARGRTAKTTASLKKDFMTISLMFIWNFYSVDPWYHGIETLARKN